MAGGDPNAKFAAKLIRAGRRKAAKKTLLSNGIAPRTRKNCDILQKMHLNYNNELVIQAPLGPQAKAPAVECLSALYKAAGESESSTDVFGWRNDLWADCRDDLKDPLGVQVGRLLQMLAEDEVTSVALTFIAVAGGLLGVNKVPKEENVQRERAGEDPLIRPANSGSIFTRRLFKVATSGVDAMRAKRALQPIQMGLGVSAGPETTALVTLCLHRAGWLIGSEDAVNRFNACTRQSILEGVEALWPEGVGLLNKFYGHPAPTLYAYADDDGRECVRVIESVEGVRMGCVAGSFAFDLAEHHFVFRHLQAKYPDCIMHALTDDLVPAFQPPEDEKDEEAWEQIYDRLAEFWNDYGLLANPIGLYRNRTKSKLLLPRGAPLPRAVPRARGIMLNGVHDGIIVAGLPVGTDEFIREHSANKVQALDGKITKVESLRANDAHIA